MFAGEAVGAVFWGYLADKIGRRKTTIARCSSIDRPRESYCIITSTHNYVSFPTLFLGYPSNAMIAGFGLASAFSRNPTEMIALRFVVGLGVGGFTVPYNLIGEVTPQSARVGFLIIMQLAWSMGSLGSAGHPCVWVPYANLNPFILKAL